MKPQTDGRGRGSFCFVRRDFDPMGEPVANPSWNVQVGAMEFLRGGAEVEVRRAIAAALSAVPGVLDLGEEDREAGGSQVTPLVKPWRKQSMQWWRHMPRRFERRAILDGAIRELPFKVSPDRRAGVTLWHHWGTRLSAKADVYDATKVVGDPPAPRRCGHLEQR